MRNLFGMMLRAFEVQNLEYEHKEAKRQVNDTGENDLQKECLGWSR